VQVKKNLSRVKVTINKKGHIPSLGLGPIRRPILITEELCDQLIKLGYPVKIIKSPTVIKPIDVKEEVETPTLSSELKTSEETEILVTEGAAEVQEPAEDEINKEDSESVIETVEEKVVDTEEEVEEILVDDPDLDAGAFYTEEFLTSKALCKKILSNRQIQYESSASFNLLKKLVLESNPEVEIIEEEVEESTSVEE